MVETVDKLPLAYFASTLVLCKATVDIVSVSGDQSLAVLREVSMLLACEFGQQL